MDPVSSLSVAANAVQLISFATKLICKSKELAKSPEGLLPENEGTETVTVRLKQLAHELQHTPELSTRSPPFSPRLQDICDECQELSDELLRRLRLLKVPDGTAGRGWKSFRQALKSVWSKDQIDDMAARLLALRAEVDTEVLLLIRDHIALVSTRHGAKLSELVAQTKTMENHLQEIKTRSTEQGETILEHIREAQAHRREFLQIFQCMDQGQKSAFGRLGRQSIKKSKRFQRLGSDIKWAVMSLAKKYDLESLGTIQSKGGRDEAQIQQETRRASARLVEQDGSMRAAKVSLDILESLQFQDIHRRYNDIAEPYQKTFTWIFEDPRKEDKPWDSFHQWLLQGSGVYWIRGKPASGKSTLMRYIWRHPSTIEALQQWSSGGCGKAELVAEAFFFWMAGSEKQRSEAGLFRTLLHSILQERPHLIAKVFPAEWERKSKLAANDMMIRPEKWSLGQLKEAFRRLLHLASPQLRFCFFIDGLDEYDGDHGDIAEFFQEASDDSPHVKACVSSRPLPVIEGTLHKVPGLRIQDLTEDDIRQYVQDRLLPLPEMQQFARQELEAVNLMVQEIIEKASGVFLWVTLVVTSLIKGLRNGDDVPHLQSHLRALPPDLEELFDKIISQIEPQYRSDSAKIFQLFRVSGHKLSILQLHQALLYHHDYREAIALSPENPSTFATPEFAERVLFLKARMMRRLHSRCGGLLEVGRGTHGSFEAQHELHEPSKGGKHATRSSAVPCSVSFDRLRIREEASVDSASGCGSESDEVDSTVSKRTVTESFDAPIAYLHRTVMDYLKKPQVWSRVVRAAPCSDTKLKLSLATSHIVEAKTMPLVNYTVYSSGMTWLRRIKLLNLDPCEPLFELVAELDSLWRRRSLEEEEEKCVQRSSIPVSTFCPKAPSWARNFVLASFELSYHMMLKAFAARTSQQTVTARTGFPLPVPRTSSNSINKSTNLSVLGYAVFVLFWGTEPSWSHLELIRELLRAGSNPNEDYNGYTIWEYAICWVHFDAGPSPEAIRDFWVPLFVLMLYRGADPFACCVDTPSCARNAIFPEGATEADAALVSSHLQAKHGHDHHSKTGSRHNTASRHRRHKHSVLHSVSAVVEDAYTRSPRHSMGQLHDFQAVVRKKKEQWIMKGHGAAETRR